VRTDKVEAIRAQITNATYNPPADAVADGLVKAHSPQRMGT
jgi:anti-sigma28 factor (negative regulator of flagellin synthesis)